MAAKDVMQHKKSLHLSVKALFFVSFYVAPVILSMDSLGDLLLLLLCHFLYVFCETSCYLMIVIVERFVLVTIGSIIL